MLISTLRVQLPVGNPRVQVGLLGAEVRNLLMAIDILRTHLQLDRVAHDLGRPLFDLSNPRTPLAWLANETS